MHKTVLDRSAGGAVQIVAERRKRANGAVRILLLLSLLLLIPLFFPQTEFAG
jgi:hypothetical protein